MHYGAWCLSGFPGRRRHQKHLRQPRRLVWTGAMSARGAWIIFWKIHIGGGAMSPRKPSAGTDRWALIH